MSITQQELDQAFSDYEKKYGGRKEDYFALLYLSKEYNCPIEELEQQVAFGGNDYGIDAFHFDKERHNLYIFQFKWSENHNLFKESFKRLKSAGIERVFGNSLQDQNQNQLLIKLKSIINENYEIIDHVLIYFIFNGDPESAEKSSVLDSLREDLEAKKHIIDGFFGSRQVKLTFQFISNKSKKFGAYTHTKRTHKYKINIEEKIKKETATGEVQHVCFVKLMDLYRMYLEMGQRFFERNIRAGLSADKPPNREIRKSLANIVLKMAEKPDVFAFNHNGVTISAENLDFENGSTFITEPRILNGAQTLTSLAKFMEENEKNPLIKKNENLLESIYVLAKIIRANSDEFIINVTICNNRQNPVESWNLRANDLLQCEFQDKFQNELHIYYERQEKAFENIFIKELENRDITQQKAIQIKPLAQAFLACQGEIDRMSRLSEVFENDNTYRNTFRDSYLHGDVRKILLVYKIHFRLRRIIREILERGQNKYYYLTNARNLIWALLIQAIFNDERLNEYCEQYGTQIYMEADFTEILNSLASRRVRPIISKVVENKQYKEMIENDKFSFLRTKEMYRRCMNIAYDRFGWNKKSF